MIFTKQITAIHIGIKITSNMKMQHEFINLQNKNTHTNPPQNHYPKRSQNFETDKHVNFEK